MGHPRMMDAMAQTSWFWRVFRYVVLLSPVALYARSLSFSFAFDDQMHVASHAGVTQLFSLRKIFGLRFWGHSFHDPDGPLSYRPLVTLSYWFDWFFGAREPWIFHLSNLVWFALLLVLAHVFLRTWLRSLMSDWLSVFVIVTFATSALLVDVVPAISGRSELMAMTFSLLGLTLVLQKRVIWAYGFAPIAFLAAILSKESALPVPLLAPLLLRPESSNETKTRTVRPMVLLGTSIGLVGSYLLFRQLKLPMTHEGERHFFDNVSRDWPIFWRIGAGFTALANYLKHWGIGIELCHDYSYAAIVPEKRVTVGLIVGFASASLLLALAIYGLVRKKYYGVALSGFFASYIVVSNWILPSVQLVADRLFFFPLFWLILSFALLVHEQMHQGILKKVCLFIAGCFSLVQLLFAQLQMGRWKDDTSLALESMASCPANFRLRLSRAVIARAEVAAWDYLIAVYLFRNAPKTIEEPWILDEDKPIQERLLVLKKSMNELNYKQLRDAASRLAVGQRRHDAAMLLARW